MRKLLALLLSICIVIPLVLASLTAAGTLSWALDRQFYMDALDQDAFYQALLSDQALDSILRSQLGLPVEADTQALDQVLRSVITQDYLKSQLSTFVNGLFDSLQGVSTEFNPSIDLQPIKTALSNEKQDEFLTALVAALPACQAGQTPGFGEGQTPCKPQGISDEMLIDNFLKPALPQYMAQLPDEIAIGGVWQEWQDNGNWQVYLPGMAGPASAMLGVLFLSFVALCFWYLTALVADSSWRVRLQWLGWTLMISALPVFILGLVLHSNTALYWAQYGLQQAHFGGMPAYLTSPAVLQALTASILPRIAGAFLAVGGVAAGLALGFIVWGLATARETQSA